MTEITRDAPIFAPETWGLNSKQAQLCTEARELAQDKFAERAFHYDREATFPTENYHDLHQAGLLGVCIPEALGGRGADLKTYMLMAAEIGRYCGATALTFNMHVSSCLWTGPLLDLLEMDPETRAEHER
ncbi:MAG: acyl-CoA dehydrogenase family protein, partial [Thiolinea sp.]